MDIRYIGSALNFGEIEDVVGSADRYREALVTLLSEQYPTAQVEVEIVTADDRSTEVWVDGRLGTVDAGYIRDAADRLWMECCEDGRIR